MTSSFLEKIKYVALGLEPKPAEGEDWKLAVLLEYIARNPKMVYGMEYLIGNARIEAGRTEFLDDTTAIYVKYTIDVLYLPIVDREKGYPRFEIKLEVSRETITPEGEGSSTPLITVRMMGLIRENREKIVQALANIAKSVFEGLKDPLVSD